ncbi:nitrile hydratase subunit alpha [Streptomyces sp. 900116325]
MVRPSPTGNGPAPGRNAGPAGALQRRHGEQRWRVLPERPAGTEGLSEEQLVPLITRDATVGVARIEAP